MINISISEGNPICYMMATTNSALRRSVCISAPPVKVDYVAKITRGKKDAAILLRHPTSMTKAKRTKKSAESALRKSVCFGTKEGKPDRLGNV